MSDPTLLWHDYETWGLDPRMDRPAQFAALRTNLELEEVEEPVVLFCRPCADALPHPEAVLLTGISPRQAARDGVNEAAFFGRINAELSRPGTCGAGYNSIRFDDEFTRFGFYRNFIDPYAREWRHGNSRWDVIDLLRMARALRPEDMEWPTGKDGSASFRLEELAKANGICQQPHDALSDVRATLELVRMVRRLKPRLYEYLFGLRHKKEAESALDPTARKIVLHVGSAHPSALGCIAPVVPLLRHPRSKNEVVVWNLRQDPGPLLAMTPEEMAENLHAPAGSLPEGTERLGLKAIHLGRAPALAPVATLTPELASRWQIDLQAAEHRRQQLLANGTLLQRLAALYAKASDLAPADADGALYEGMISQADQVLCRQVLEKNPEQLAAWKPPFADERLQTLYFRYRARNWPESLSAKEQEQWRHFCEARLLEGQFGNQMTVGKYWHVLHELGDKPEAAQKPGLFRELMEWTL